MDKIRDAIPETPASATAQDVVNNMEPTVAPIHLTTGLPAEQFGLAVGRIMDRFGIMELTVYMRDGATIGTLFISGATAFLATWTAIAWKPVEEGEIISVMADVDRHDFRLTSGIINFFDDAGLEQLDAYRVEILTALINAGPASGRSMK